MLILKLAYNEELTFPHDLQELRESLKKRDIRNRGCSSLLWYIIRIRIENEVNIIRKIFALFSGLRRR